MLVPFVHILNVPCSLIGPHIRSRRHVHRAVTRDELLATAPTARRRIVWARLALICASATSTVATSPDAAKSTARRPI
jgi:hypothetical protein